MIVEGIVTSIDVNDILNVAPMGPIVRGDFESLIMRPFQTSTTFRNLHDTGCGVFHVVDTVDLIVRAAIGRLSVLPATHPADRVSGRILDDCCRWFEFEITERDLTDQRTVLHARIVARGERRPFFGFNRARHALLEAAILATRVHLISQHDVIAQFSWLESAIHKTGGDVERELFALLVDFVNAAYETKS